MKSKGMAMVLFVASIVAAILAVVDALGVSVWLAANSWLIVAAVLGIWAMYLDEK